MYPASFEYYRPKNLKDAVSLLRKKKDSKLLAGGHSLLPAMKLRVSSPAAIIDIGRLKGLSGIKVGKSSVKIGGLTTHTEVAESENALSIGHDDHTDVLLRPIAEDLRDAALVVRRDEEPFWLADDVRKLPAGFAHGGRVDQGKDFFQVLNNGPVEKMLVPFLHRRERHVTVDVARVFPQRLHHPIDELRRRRNRMGQQSLQTQAQPLLASEGNRLVKGLVAQDLERSLGCHG